MSFLVAVWSGLQKTGPCQWRKGVSGWWSGREAGEEWWAREVLSGGWSACSPRSLRFPLEEGQQATLHLERLYSVSSTSVLKKG